MRIFHDDPRPIPDFDVLAVYKLRRLSDGLLVVGALDHFRRASEVALTIKEVDAVSWHDAGPLSYARCLVGALSHRLASA